MTINQTLTLKEKIGQLFMIGFNGHDVPEEVAEFIETYNIGSVILFARNIDTPEQATRLTQRIHSLGKVPPFIFTDQEGGTVVQYKELAATCISAMGLAATGDPANARLAGRIIGEDMKLAGIDGVLAPVLDVNYEETNPIIGIRSFSDEPGVVIEYASNFVKGLNEAGVAACGKHFPGHGGTVADSHQVIPRVSISPEYFSHYCFSPFLVLAAQGIDAIMSAHVQFPAITQDIATFSSLLIHQLLRKKAGFNGLIISDCMEMRAVSDNFSAQEIVEKAINAGIDLMIVSHTLSFQKQLADALYTYVKNGAISEERIDASVARLLKLKQKYQTGMNPQIQQNLRSHRSEEEQLALKSITLLRNKKQIIPINKKSPTLILEWGKVKSSMTISEIDNISMLAPVAEQYLENFKVEILDPALPLKDNIVEQIKNAEYVVAGTYTRMPEIGQLQAEVLKEILKIRSDIIVVAIGNPYDISYFPKIENYIVTYGFRRIQLEALFKILTGQVAAQGKLPVQIKKIFPRGFSI